MGEKHPHGKISNPAMDSALFEFLFLFLTLYSSLINHSCTLLFSQAAYTILYIICPRHRWQHLKIQTRSPGGLSGQGMGKTMLIRPPNVIKTLYHVMKCVFAVLQNSLLRMGLERRATHALQLIFRTGCHLYSIKYFEHTYRRT